MRFNKLSDIEKTVFTSRDVARALGISQASARVSVCRYAAKGLMIRLKRDRYALPETWKRLDGPDAFMAAGILQPHSYISFTTALAYYDLTTQVQRGFYESVALKRTREFEIAGRAFVFTKIKDALYCGFERKYGFFIATPEKALLDAMYLVSIGKYAMDFDAVDFTGLRKAPVKKLLKKFPGTVAGMWRRYVGPF